MARRVLSLVAAVLLLGALAAPARAIGAFGPPVTIADPPCEFDAWNVDLARDAGEVAHGFADLWGAGCNEGFAIQYFEGSGTTWTAQATPYRGFVAAVAWDPTGTYLLYVDFATFNLRITKRLTNGTYTGGRLLSTHVDVDGSLPQGDVVAVGGRWWAVWREHVAPGGSPGGEDDQTDLFQASTIGGTLHARQRITTNPRWDSMPTLAAVPGSTFPLTLIWSRGGSDLDPGQTDLRRALGRAGGTWSSNTFATRGTLNFWPDAQVVGTTTYVAWLRDDRAVAADNGGGVVCQPHLQHAGDPARPSRGRGLIRQRSGRLDGAHDPVSGVCGQAGRHNLDGHLRLPRLGDPRAVPPGGGPPWREGDRGDPQPALAAVCDHRDLTAGQGEAPGSASNRRRRRPATRMKGRRGRGDPSQRSSKPDARNGSERLLRTAQPGRRTVGAG